MRIITQRTTKTNFNAVKSLIKSSMFEMKETDHCTTSIVVKMVIILQAFLCAAVTAHKERLPFWSTVNDCIPNKNHSKISEKLAYTL